MAAPGEATIADGWLSASIARADHTHPLASLEQSGAAPGQVPTWAGVGWLPQTPAGGTVTSVA